MASGEACQASVIAKYGYKGIPPIAAGQAPPIDGGVANSQPVNWGGGLAQAWVCLLKTNCSKLTRGLEPLHLNARSAKRFEVLKF